ncbi:MAG: 4Fe-4S binding protein, partial [Deltaproteobacteria bacterium]|nr:4Fe-4S binding protein [Deltaproteobacteria bacterium]
MTMGDDVYTRLRAFLDAIKLDGDFSEIIDGRCIGCGVCIPTCPEEAISLVVK